MNKSHSRLVLQLVLHLAVGSFAFQYLCDELVQVLLWLSTDAMFTCFGVC